MLEQKCKLQSRKPAKLPSFAHCNSCNFMAFKRKCLGFVMRSGILGNATSLAGQQLSSRSCRFQRIPAMVVLMFRKHATGKGILSEDYMTWLNVPVCNQTFTFSRNISHADSLQGHSLVWNEGLRKCLGDSRRPPLALKDSMG